MTAAIFGLIGVCVGAVLNGAVSLFTDRLRERRAARAATLLVVEELMRSMAPLLALGQKRTWSAVNVVGFGQRQQWDENRAVLQAVVSVDDWKALSSTFIHLERAAAQLALHPATKQLTEEEGWEMGRTYLLVCLALHILGDAAHAPSRLHPRKRREYFRTSAEKKAKLMKDEHAARRSSGTWSTPFDTPAHPDPSP